MEQGLSSFSCAQGDTIRSKHTFSASTLLPVPRHHRPLRKTDDSLTNFVILVVLWPKLDHVGVITGDSTSVLGAIFPRSTVRSG